ncbi:hypothetical protein [Anaerocolumna sp. MB42-C2]|uniref:hypothetical protein n=1 Tax=Anaerocolumna sp. MB42-C2 TaxID=3070997 RepID=UPI0027E0103B|nr:hypothetical protein [Anaerocolumna sp. MB42-C2]WMJ87165.1 hypothetical protein RBU59_24505 [Anaerocolumna sp. MB42-C2]
MTLNDYKDEAKDFLIKINAINEGTAIKLNWLEEEFLLLKDATNKEEKDKIRHQIYDMLFLLFELSADYDFDIDSEWNLGRQRKLEKYLPEGNK